MTGVVILAVLLSVPLAVAANMFLPARFSFDADAIQLIAQGRYAPTGDQSFYNVGRLYGALGMANLPWLAGLLGLALAGGALGAALRSSRGRLTSWGVILIGSYVVLESVYLSEYSKDVWVIPVVIATLFAGPGLRGEAVVIGAASLYALNFRTYWFLVVLVYLLLRAITWRRISRTRVLLVVVVTLIAVVVLWPIVLGQDINMVRQSTNLGRVDSANATTLISTPALGSGPVAGSLEVLVVLGGLIAPIPLLALGSAQYLVYAAAIGFLWWSLGQVTLRPSVGLFVAPRSAVTDRQVRSALFAIAFVTTQSLFEPDYGSYIRHLTPILPLVLAAVFSAPRTPFLRPFRPRGEDAEIREHSLPPASG